jgi:hypothetical protein
VDGSGVPQARQKLALAGLGSPQAGQTVMSPRYRPAAPPPRFFSASLRRRTASISAWSAAAVGSAGHPAARSARDVVQLDSISSTSGRGRVTGA